MSLFINTEITFHLVHPGCCHEDSDLLCVLLQLPVLLMAELQVALVVSPQEWTEL